MVMDNDAHRNENLSIDTPDRRTTVFDRIGGRRGCFNLASAFYTMVANEPLIRPLYPAKLGCPTRSLAQFFVHLFGGDDGSPTNLVRVHDRFALNPERRKAWLRCMHSALSATAPDPELAHQLFEMFTRAASFVSGGAVGEDADAFPLNPALAGWHEHELLEELWSAAESGNAAHALEVSERPLLKARLDRDPVSLLATVAVFARSGSGVLYARAREWVEANPRLTTARHSHQWSLLHEAALNRLENFMAFLLEHGADPNATDSSNHAPLYCVANSIGDDLIAAAIAERLIAAGALVNAAGGVQRCTALHMAARRGNSEVISTLCKRGANVDAIDRAGNTPLRRAVNCNRLTAARVLLSYGASPTSVGSGGLTPREAARTPEVRAVFAPPPPKQSG